MTTPAPALTALRVLAPLAAVTAVLVTAVGVASGFARTTTQDVFAARGVDVVEVALDAGDVVVGPADGDEVTVDVTAVGTWDAPRTAQRQDGGTLRLSARCGPTIAFTHCDVTYRLRVPDGVDLDLRSATGRIHVDEVDGAVTATTNAGDIELTDLRSTEVTARSDVGRVAASFDTPPQAVVASSATGAVEIVLPHEGEPYAVDTRADVGGTVVDVRTDPASPRRVEARTSVGAVWITSR
ncbi:MAG: hypothetical protein ACOYXW_00520 [Actinomycetota bacterium]